MDPMTLLQSGFTAYGAPASALLNAMSSVLESVLYVSPHIYATDFSNLWENPEAPTASMV